ncbi:glutathione S-transferase [Methylophaga sp. 42_25_T18]|nr:glutathione S-transferase [Methylophaga sp. 42_25_T18]
MSNVKLYRHPLSGHSHRAQLFLSLLGLSAELVDVDLMTGEHKQAEFLSKNIFGQVPVLEDGDDTIADSNAILTYLAMKYDQGRTWLPTLPSDAAEVERFLSVSAGPLANGPAAARLVNVFNSPIDHQDVIDKTHALLEIFENHLQGRDWLVTNKPTIADIANYSYIAHAPEGDVSLDNYTNIKQWLKRIESLPGFVAMKTTEVGLCKVA